MNTEKLVELRGIKKYFPIKKGFFGFSKSAVRAVDDISFDIMEGETLGLVGESGCGKSTTGRLMLRLLEPTTGKIKYEGRDIADFNHSELKAMRRKAQMIFQDPYASLNPRMTIGEIIEEPMKIHNLGLRKERENRVYELLELVGLSRYHLPRYPHEFSGGQRQRIGIARALAVNPKLLVCDEPVSALDVSIQAQVLNLLQDLQEQLALTFLFIAHDLSVIKHVSDRIGVMYLGRLVEIGPSDHLYYHHKHPYSKALINASPIPDPRKRKTKLVIEGDIPSPSDPPSGCTFHTRCNYTMDICRKVRPMLKEYSKGHLAACHIDDDITVTG